LDTGEWMDGFFMQEVSGCCVRVQGSKTTPLWEVNIGYDDLFGLSDKDLKERIQFRLFPFVQNVKKL
jgi:hypothetical protein